MQKPARKIEYQKTYYARNRTRLRAQQKEYSLKNKEIRKIVSRRHTLKKKYGLTLEQYNEMLEDQNWGCAVCGDGPERTVQGTLPVDHCHKTGKIRGLLCDRCNRALGLLRDSAVNVRALLRYLEGA